MRSQLEEIKQIRHSVLLAKPHHEKIKDPYEKNIFASFQCTQSLPTIKKIKGKQYHVVGPKEVRNMILQNEEEKDKEVEEARKNTNNETGLSQTYMNTTINRKTILSKINKDKQNAITREAKQMNRYREYKQFWDGESQKLRKKSLKQPSQKTLLQDNVKQVYVHDNPLKDDIINHHVVHYWEMSLRNNSNILRRHIKGHKFNQIHLQELLQTDQGIKTVEKSIPVLPIQDLKMKKKKQLSLSGRNKFLSEIERTSENILTRRTSVGQSQNQEEVFKINYTGNLRWMSTQGLALT